jgi:hypothetical protein
MAAVLGRSNYPFLARVRAKREFGNRSHPVVGTAVDSSGGASVLDYIRLRYFRRRADAVDSIRDAQALLEIRLGISGSARIEQQYRSLTPRLK